LKSSWRLLFSLVKLDMDLHATVKVKASQLIDLIKKEYRLVENE
jgi:hypothetical protein